jgi:hypothetical protein
MLTLQRANKWAKLYNIDESKIAIASLLLLLSRVHRAGAT